MSEETIKAPSVTVESFTKADRMITPQRGLVFESDRQRNVSFIEKGITKPGRISFDVLRRAAQSVHIARICINTLKEKVTKTKWVVKPIDSTDTVSDKKDPRIKEVTDLFRHPNKNDETMRTLLDKMVEDLLVLDSVSVEKTRFPDGKLAELHFVDSSTIRPVFDEHGNQDVQIPLDTKDGMDDLPVSYVQILNNSQYGGPESGEIIAAWPKRDFLNFHMHPQGSMEGIGYGLSPLEGVISVVANLLNIDNYNGTYFEDGAFPPIILQIMGQVNQRDVEAYRQYLTSELMGNFHRPAIMAGGTDAKVLNLKDATNNDMQMMEYNKFLARLLAAAYGLGGQDIGLTDDVGSKNVSETQKDISDQKGYSSILHLIKEVFNQEIIWKDFGYEDLEFDWVGTDIVDPKDGADIATKNLQAGVWTVNEARRAAGKEPYEDDTFNQPMVLTASGYVPMISTQQDEEGDGEAKGDEEKTDQPEKKEADTKEEGERPDEVGKEKPYRDQSDTPKKKSMASRILAAISSKNKNKR
jgi:hypothetical protein